MTSAAEQLERIGFRNQPADPVRWRVTRLDGAVYRESSVAPEHSRALMRWRVLLARGSRRSPYRIARVER
jgi:hypothetical protein